MRGAWRIVEQFLERAHRHGGDVGLVEGLQPLLGGAILQQRIEDLVELQNCPEKFAASRWVVVCATIEDVQAHALAADEG